MKNLKRIIALLLVSVSVFSFAACSDSDSDSGDGGNTSKSEKAAQKELDSLVGTWVGTADRSDETNKQLSYEGVEADLEYIINFTLEISDGKFTIDVDEEALESYNTAFTEAYIDAQYNSYVKNCERANQAPMTKTSYITENGGIEKLEETYMKQLALDHEDSGDYIFKDGKPTLSGGPDVEVTDSGLTVDFGKFKVDFTKQ